MGKLSKIEQARMDGFNRACRIAREQGVEALLAEQKRRGMSGLSLCISDADFRAQMSEWKGNCLQTVLVMTLSVLRDVEGYGKKRMERFIRRFNLKSNCLADDYVTWPDIARQLLAETHIEYDIGFFEEGKV